MKQKMIICAAILLMSCVKRETRRLQVIDEGKAFMQTYDVEALPDPSAIINFAEKINAFSDSLSLYSKSQNEELSVYAKKVKSVLDNGKPMYFRGLRARYLQIALPLMFSVEVGVNMPDAELKDVVFTGSVFDKKENVEELKNKIAPTLKLLQFKRFALDSDGEDVEFIKL